MFHVKLIICTYVGFFPISGGLAISHRFPETARNHQKSVFRSLLKVNAISRFSITHPKTTQLPQSHSYQSPRKTPNKPNQTRQPNKTPTYHTTPETTIKPNSKNSHINITQQNNHSSITQQTQKTKNQKSKIDLLTTIINE